MKKRHKEYNLFSSILKSLIFAFLIMVGAAYFLKYNIILVNGRSAEPFIQYKSVILIKKCPKEDLKLGDFVTFTLTANSTDYITHQIYKFESNGDIICKGYHYDKTYKKFVLQEDSQTVKYENIVGKVVYANYLLGNTIFVLKSNPFVAVAVLGGIVLAFIEMDRLKTTSDYDILNL